VVGSSDIPQAAASRHATSQHLGRAICNYSYPSSRIIRQRRLGRRDSPPTPNEASRAPSQPFLPAAFQFVQLALPFPPTFSSSVPSQLVNYLTDLPQHRLRPISSVPSSGAAVCTYAATARRLFCRAPATGPNKLASAPRTAQDADVGSGITQLPLGDRPRRRAWQFGIDGTAAAAAAAVPLPVALCRWWVWGWWKRNYIV
jgi:hypothetical protein